MAGGQERILRGRIKSVQSTKKITKAMELIAASRIVKAQARVAAARPYAEQITEVIRNLAAGGAGTSTTRCSPAATRSARSRFIAVTADRGLAGGYNTGVIRHIERPWPPTSRARPTKLYTIGKKATGYFKFRNVPIEATFLGVTDQPTYDQAKEIAVAVAAAFDSGEVDAVEVVYNEFLSAGSQRVVQKRLMPLDTAAVEEATEGGATASYEFEPGARPDPRAPPAPLRRGPALRRPPRRLGVRARLPPAGHEGGLRQRRRAHQDPQPHHEPGPPGLHHHRDHGDRRRRRGDAPGPDPAARDLLLDHVGGTADLFRSITHRHPPELTNEGSSLMTMTEERAPES